MSNRAPKIKGILKDELLINTSVASANARLFVQQDMHEFGVIVRSSLRR